MIEKLAIVSFSNNNEATSNLISFLSNPVTASKVHCTTIAANTKAYNHKPQSQGAGLLQRPEVPACEDGKDILICHTVISLKYCDYTYQDVVGEVEEGGKVFIAIRFRTGKKVNCT